MIIKLNKLAKHCKRMLNSLANNHSLSPLFNHYKKIPIEKKFAIPESKKKTVYGNGDCPGHGE